MEALFSLIKVDFMNVPSLINGVSIPHLSCFSVYVQCACARLSVCHMAGLKTESVHSSQE